MKRPARVHARRRRVQAIAIAWTLAWTAVATPALAQSATLPQAIADAASSDFISLLRNDPTAQPLQQILDDVARHSPTPRLAPGKPSVETPIEQPGRAAAPAAPASEQATAGQTIMGPNHRLIELPDRIPAQCVKQAADRYQVPEMAMLAILRQESGGQTGIIGKNTDGSLDYGPAQFNSNSWARYMRERYGISTARLTNDMCQALMAQAYALRWEWNRCINQRGQTSIWCAVAYYHSPTKEKQDIYIRSVWRQHQRIIATGKF